MTALRIGMITPGWPGTKTANGISTAVYQLATGLAEIGHHPVILARNIDGPLPEGIPVVTTPERHWRLRDRLLSRVAPSAATRRVVARAFAEAAQEAAETHAIDVLLMEEGQGWSELVQKWSGVPVVTVLHGPWTALAPMMSDLDPQEDQRRIRREGSAMRHTAGLIAPSENVLREVEAVYDLSTVTRAVIPNAYGEGPRPASFGTGAFARILFVGRYDRIKGGDTAIDAFAMLHARMPDTRLTFAGPDIGIPGPDGAPRRIGERIAGLPAATGSAIEVPGLVSKEDLARLRRTHGIALLASRFETFGFTAVEAMAAGQAIVATDMGGYSEILEHEVTALLVPPDDPRAMAAALGRLVEDPDLARRLGTAAHERVIRDFAPSVVAGRVVDFLRDILPKS